MHVCTSHCFSYMERSQCILILLVHASCICAFPSLSCTQIPRNPLSNVLHKCDLIIFLGYEFLHLHIFLFIHFHSINKCSIFQAFYFLVIVKGSCRTNVLVNRCCISNLEAYTFIYTMYPYTPSIQDAQIPIVRLMPPYTPISGMLGFRMLGQPFSFSCMYLIPSILYLYDENVLGMGCCFIYFISLSWR